MLFGHQSDDANQPAATAPATQPSNVNPLAVDPATGASLPVAPMPPRASDPSESTAFTQTVTPSLDVVAPTAPAVDSFVPAAVTEAVETVPAPIVPLSASDAAAVASVPAPEFTPEPASEPTPALGQPSNDDLLSLKQHALEQLGPLVGQLDQTPEERFRTTMMMIQSTDNQALLPVAYEAAQNIVEEKVRAQALLDIVNEINYFIQPKAA